MKRFETMPYTVQQLFDDRESVIPPIGIERNASVQDAFIF